jgi:hypothetical protein
MNRILFVSLFLIVGISITALCGSKAHADVAGVLCTRDEPCDARGVYTKKMVGASRTDSIRLNPANIPTEAITGIETIYNKGMPTVGLVKGLGRIGAAVTPSNNEETFFGAPAEESDLDLYDRMSKRDPYDSEKYTFGAGFNIFSNRGRGLSNITWNIGALLRYYGASKSIAPGVGTQLVTGPILLGASVYEDENTYTNSGTGETDNKHSPVRTYSVGLSLSSLLLDYSIVETEGYQPARAQVGTAALFLGKRTVLTLARREVESDKPRYSFEQKALVVDRTKVEYFGGLQYRVARFLVLGVHYNYYLLREASAGAVIFF